MKTRIVSIIAISTLVVACGKHDAPEDPSTTTSTKSAQDAVRALDGKKLFRSEGCGACHSAISGGIEPAVKPGEEATDVTDLSGLAEKRKSEWLKLYLQKQEALGGRKHPTRPRESGAELDALAAWLMSLPPASAKR